MLIGLNLICVLFLVGVAIILALLELRLTSPIVLGGLIFLFAPFAVQDLPANIKDSKLGLLLLLVLQAAAISTLYAAGALAPLEQLFGA